jgi:hypothetical protein
MSKSQDPPRLADASSDTTDPVRAVLRAGKRELPAPDDLARLASRLPLGPLPPPSGSAPPAASPPLAPVDLVAPAAAPSVIPGAIVGALLALGVVGGVWWHDAAVAPQNAAATSRAALAAPAPAPSPPADPGLDRPDPELASDVAKLPSSSSAPAPPSAPLSDAGAALQPAGNAAIPPPNEGSPAGESPPALASAPDDETEVHLLQRAQDALGTDPGAALALTGEHTRRFAGGALGQESEFIAIRALLALGRAPEARARAASLLERFPSSAYRGRLESLGLGNTFQKNEPASPRTQ